MLNLWIRLSVPFHQRNHSALLINLHMIGISLKIKRVLRKKWKKPKKMGIFILSFLYRYIEKQEFLSRVDYRQFEKERQQRERERIQRENEWRQRQR